MLPWYDVLGVWCAIFLTMCIFSFLYEDNPAYKFAEHLFLGVSIGISVGEQWYGVLRPNFFGRFADGLGLGLIGAMILMVLLLMKLSRKYSYFARTPIALMVAAFAAVKLTGEASGNLMVQVSDSMPNLTQVYAQHGWWSWSADGAGVFSSLLLVAGLVSCLVYFYFSVPHEGPLKPVSRFGIWVLMVGFGASFGYTVMGRISLAYGRVLVLVGLDRPPTQAAQLHAPVVTLISVLVIAGILYATRLKAPPEETPSS